MTNIYLASPFFNDEEIARVGKAEQVLRAGEGLDVFSPREQQFKHLEYGSEEWRQTVFKNDVEKIHWSDVVVAIYDGLDPGTMWEIGFAYTWGKKIVVFSETGIDLNLMISDSLHAYLANWLELELYDFKSMPRIPYTFNVY